MMCVYVFLFCLVGCLTVHLLSKQRERDVELSGWEGAKDIEGVARRETVVKIYRIIFFSIKNFKKPVMEEHMWNARAMETKASGFLDLLDSQV